MSIQKSYFFQKKLNGFLFWFRKKGKTARENQGDTPAPLETAPIPYLLPGKRPRPFSLDTADSGISSALKLFSTRYPPGKNIFFDISPLDNPAALIYNCIDNFNGGFICDSA